MFTVTKVISVNNGKELVEAACLSTDTKPTKFANGSLCLEMDTGAIHAFNETGSNWVPIS